MLFYVFKLAAKRAFEPDFGNVHRREKPFLFTGFNHTFFGACVRVGAQKLHRDFRSKVITAEVIT